MNCTIGLGMLQLRDDDLARSFGRMVISSAKPMALDSGRTGRNGGSWTVAASLQHHLQHNKLFSKKNEYGDAVKRSHTIAINQNSFEKVFIVSPT